MCMNNVDLLRSCKIHVYFQMSVLMDTGSVPSSLRPYLSLYSEVILESPVLRDGSKWEVHVGYKSC